MKLVYNISKILLTISFKLYKEYRLDLLSIKHTVFNNI